MTIELSTAIETITADNIVKVVGDCIGNYYYNKTIIIYSNHYKRVITRFFRLYGIKE